MIMYAAVTLKEMLPEKKYYMALGLYAAAAVALFALFYPVLSGLIERIPRNVGEPLFWVLLVFMIINCLVSWTAIIRQNLRHHDVPPLTPIGQFYDEYYNDTFLEKYFPNMVRSE